jgi:DNA-binding NarL/FixJ family response regulator
MLLARVLSLWDQVPDAAGKIGGDRVRVLEEAVSAARDAGEFQRGLAFASAAIAELDSETEPVRVAELLGQQAVFKDNLGLPGSADDLNRALRLLPDSAPIAVRFSLLTDSLCTAYAWRQVQVRQWVDEAMRFAREAGDLEAESRALLMLAFFEASSGAAGGSGSEAMGLITRGRDAAQRAGAYHMLLRAAQYESHLLCGNGDYERAAEVARQGIADAQQYGLARTAGASLAINVAEPLAALGRWDEVLDVAERTLELAPPPRTRTPLWVMSGSIALARGDVGTAAQMAAAGQSVLSGLRYEDQFHPAHGLLATDLKLATEGPAAAVATATGLLDRFDVPTSGPRYLWPFVVVAAWAARCAVAQGSGAEAVPTQAGDTEAGDTKAGPGRHTAEIHANEAATALLARLRTIAEKLEVFGPVQEAWRLTYTAIDQADTDQTDPDQTDSDRADTDRADRDLAAWDTAATAWEALGQPEQTAVTLTHAARAALSGADGRSRESATALRDAAADRLRRAAPLAEQLRARPLSEQITDLARRAGISLPGNGTRPAANQVGLTSRESEVLRHLAAGQSNKDIAAALFISPKTASVHVSNILAKLGAATRTEAAAKARSLRLLDLPARSQAGPHRPVAGYRPDSANVFVRAFGHVTPRARMRIRAHYDLPECAFGHVRREAGRGGAGRGGAGRGGAGRGGEGAGVSFGTGFRRPLRSRYSTEIRCSASRLCPRSCSTSPSRSRSR